MLNYLPLSFNFKEFCQHLVGLMQREKTSLMTTPKCLGVQIWQMNLQIYLAT